MNLAYNYQLIPNYRRTQDMKTFLRGTYWERDVWELNDSFFEMYHTDSTRHTLRRINFSEYPEHLKLELKYYFAIRVSKYTMRLSTICSDYQFIIREFIRFLEQNYPTLQSFSEIKIDEMRPLWLNYLQQSGYRYPRQGYTAQLFQLYLFFSDFYDTRDEYDKDIWDCRKLPSVKIPVNSTGYYINFLSIPPSFRSMTKRYMKLRLTVCAVSTAQLELNSISYLFQFVADREPDWTGLQALTRRHMEEFLVCYLSNHNSNNRRDLDRLICIKNFLERIQQFNYPDAPQTPAPSLMYYEDIPRPGLLPPKSDRIKYIPEGVMAQLQEHLECLTPSEYIPIVIILIASGWRASDVLNLKYDTCLAHTEQGWYLQGDIQKTKMIAHRIPITDEVKVVIESVATIARAKSTAENNPRHLLFNRYTGKRMGNSPDNKRIMEALNRLAEKYKITDDQGNIYYFRLHAFRHTKGVELINNGMSLVHVQKWMAHMSPEMTLVYAQVLDKTLRKSWEQAVKNGLFRITDSGQLKKVDISDIENEDMIEWEYIRYNLDAVRMPLGYCLKPKKQDCFTQLNPCLTCRNLCTTPDFLPQYEMEIEETKVLIERGKAQGREIWVEKNTHLLERYEEIIAILRTGRTRHIAGKKGREYIGRERENIEQTHT